MTCFFYDVTDVVNITNVANVTNTRECGFSECDITNTRECSSSECVKSTHSRIAPGSIRATTRCTLYTEGAL